MSYSFVDFEGAPNINKGPEIWIGNPREYLVFGVPDAKEYQILSVEGLYSRYSEPIVTKHSYTDGEFPEGLTFAPRDLTLWIQVPNDPIKKQYYIGQLLRSSELKIFMPGIYTFQGSTVSIEHESENLRSALLKVVFRVHQPWIKTEAKLDNHGTQQYIDIVFSDTNQEINDFFKNNFWKCDPEGGAGFTLTVPTIDGTTGHLAGGFRIWCDNTPFGDLKIADVDGHTAASEVDSGDVYELYGDSGIVFCNGHDDYTVYGAFYGELMKHFYNARTNLCVNRGRDKAFKNTYPHVTGVVDVICSI